MPQGVLFQAGGKIDLDASFSIGADAGTTIAVGIQFKDRLSGNVMGEAVAVPWYFSSDAAGQVIATAGSGGVAIGTDGFLIEWTADLSGLMISEADGDVDIVITEAGALDMYLNLVMPNGRIVTSSIISFSA